MSKRAQAKKAQIPALRPVDSADAVWLQDSATNLMVINSILVLDRLDLATFRRAFAERVLGSGEGNRYPRFRQRIARIGGRFYWQEDPDYDIERHVFPAPAGIRTAAELQDHVSSLAHQPLPDDRPRWQVQHIEDFEGGGSALFVRVHHCMGDGLALVPVLFSLMDEPDGCGLPGDRVAKPPRNKWALAATLPILAPLMLAQKFLWRPDRSAVHGPPLGGTKRVAWTRRIHLDEVKRIRVRFQATVNDVLMACVAGAFHRYLGETSGEVVASVRAAMPVSMRSVGEPPVMNNRFAAVLLELPAGIRDVAARIAETKKRMDAMKRSVEPLVTYAAARLMLQALPYTLSGKVLDYLANKCTAVVTNVPGPQEPLSIVGSLVRSMVFWVPQRSQIGIGISIFSFSGHVQLGIIADTALIPDPRAFAAAFEAEFDHMCEVAAS